MFEIKKGTKHGDPLSCSLFNTVDLPRWQIKEGIDICSGDNDHDCFTNLRFADDVLLFASTKEQLQKCLSTEKVGLKILQKKKKNENSQQPKLEQKRRNRD